jgi:Cysteine-rich CPXCG
MLPLIVHNVSIVRFTVFSSRRSEAASLYIAYGTQPTRKNPSLFPAVQLSASIPSWDAKAWLSGRMELRYRNAREYIFTCPSCGEAISMVLDLSVSRHTYIEDCEVCCKPVEISDTVQDDTVVSFSANTLED